CPKGYYCPNGTRHGTQFACPKGTYNDDTHLEAAEQCKACTAGMYCATDGLSQPTAECAASFYCTLGATVSGPMDMSGDVCPAGSYCAQGSERPTPCPVGSFSNVVGNHNVSQCQACTAGRYCNGSGLTAPTAACPAGFYCPEGTGEPHQLCRFGY